MLDRETLKKAIADILSDCSDRNGRVSIDALNQMADLFERKCREMYGDRDPPERKG